MDTFHEELAIENYVFLCFNNGTTDLFSLKYLISFHKEKLNSHLLGLCVSVIIDLYKGKVTYFKGITNCGFQNLNIHLGSYFGGRLACNTHAQIFIFLNY